MKFFIFALAFVAATQALDLKPVYVEPKLPFRRFPNIKHGGRITGGDEVEPHSVPHQVGLFIPTDDGTAFCGGSLINPTTVVTAAHCGELSAQVEVILGAHKIREEEPEQVRVNSTQVIVHPGWNRLLLENDIAIVKIDAVELNDNIQPIALPADDSSDYNEDVATATGWGKDSDAADSISEVLRKVEFAVIPNESCNIYYLGVIQDTNICTDGVNGKSTCSGDSGGPLVASTGELIGVTSFGISFGCEIGWPPAFTRVTKYLDWIAENSN